MKEQVEKLEAMKMVLPKEGKCINLETHFGLPCTECEKAKSYNKALDDAIEIISATN